MSDDNVTQFPKKGILRDVEGTAIGAYHGYTPEEAEAKRREAEEVFRSVLETGLLPDGTLPYFMRDDEPPAA